MKLTTMIVNTSGRPSSRAATPMTTETMADMTRAALPVVAQDPAGVADEAVDVAAQRRARTLPTTARRKPVAVLEQVVHDQRAEDDAADQADDAADTLDHLGEEAVGDHRGGLLGGRPGVLQRGLVDPGDVELFGGVVQRVVGRRHRSRRPGRSRRGRWRRRRRPSAASRPSTISPAARVGFSLCRWRTPTSGLKMMASTAAKVIGSTISLNAPSTMTTMTAAIDEPDEGSTTRPRSWASGSGGRPARRSPSPRRRRRFAAIGDVGLDGGVGDVGHGNRPPGVTGRWIRSCSRVVGAVERVAKAQLVGGWRERWAGAVGEGPRLARRGRARRSVRGPRRGPTPAQAPTRMQMAAPENHVTKARATPKTPNCASLLVTTSGIQIVADAANNGRRDAGDHTGRRRAPAPARRRAAGTTR